MRARGWNVDSFSGSVRTLRIVTGHLGAVAPIHETDIRAQVSLRPTLHGARLINYLRLREPLVSESAAAPELRRARQLASAIPSEAFSDAAHCWIDVLLGQGSKPSRARAPKTVENYVREVVPTLTGWIGSGISGPREVTTEHIKDDLKPLFGSAARRLHSALRSYFRALKRERQVFRDPARTVRLTAARPLPESLPTERIVGLLDRLSDARSRFMVGLVAIHALYPWQMVQLRQTDLDWSRARLRIRRPGRIDHLLYLDEFTLKLATAWALERRRRWPDSSNPNLFITRNTAVDDSGPPISDGVVSLVFRRIGVTAGASSTRHATRQTLSGSCACSACPTSPLPGTS
jgi:site-specific recombinase XerD